MGLSGVGIGRGRRENLGKAGSDRRRTEQARRGGRRELVWTHPRESLSSRPEPSRALSPRARRFPSLFPRGVPVVSTCHSSRRDASRAVHVDQHLGAHRSYLCLATAALAAAALVGLAGCQTAQESLADAERFRDRPHHRPGFVETAERCRGDGLPGMGVRGAAADSGRHVRLEARRRAASKCGDSSDESARPEVPWHGQGRIAGPRGSPILGPDAT